MKKHQIYPEITRNYIIYIRLCFKFNLGVLLGDLLMFGDRKLCVSMRELAEWRLWPKSKICQTRYQSHILQHAAAHRRNAEHVFCCRSTHNETHTLAPTTFEVTLFDRLHKTAAKQVVAWITTSGKSPCCYIWPADVTRPNHHVCNVTATTLFLPRLCQHLFQLCVGGAGELLKVTSPHPAEWLSWPCINITIGMTELLPRWLLLALAFLLLCYFVSYWRTHSPLHILAFLFLICLGIFFKCSVYYVGYSVFRWTDFNMLTSLLLSGIHGFVSVCWEGPGKGATGA